MYFGIRDRDPGRARNGMVIGIVITVMFLILIMFAIYASQQAIINSGVREQLEEAREQLDAYDPRPEPEPSTTEQETPTPQNPTLDKIIAYDPSLAAMFSDARFNSPNREPSHDEFWIKTEDGVFTQFTLEYMASLIDNGYFHRAWQGGSFSGHCGEQKLWIHEEKQHQKGMLQMSQFLTAQERLDYREEANMRLLALEIYKAQICT